MILAFDTYYYPDQSANTVCIGFNHWEDSAATDIYIERLTGVANYQSGEFYKRELPCILSLWEKVPHKNIEAIVVDGFVYLDDYLKYGLGGHLYEALNSAIPIIGVAKTNFATIVANKTALVRGESKRPLYITSIGIDLEVATKAIRKMHGEFRIPTLLKELDRLTKGSNS